MVIIVIRIWVLTEGNSRVKEMALTNEEGRMELTQEEVDNACKMAFGDKECTWEEYGIFVATEVPRLFQKV